MKDGHPSTSITSGEKKGGANKLSYLTNDGGRISSPEHMEGFPFFPGVADRIFREELDLVGVFEGDLIDGLGVERHGQQPVDLGTETGLGLGDEAADGLVDRSGDLDLPAGGDFDVDPDRGVFQHA